MKNKYIFVLVMLLAITLVSLGITGIYVKQTNKTNNENQLTVVTSFYPMYIATLNLVDGVEGINLENLSEPKTGCLHDYQLTPEDMKLLSTADIFVINGGGIESFISDVAEAYPDLSMIEACEDVALISDEDEENAHAWMSVSDYRIQVKTIADSLSKLDPDNSEKYRANYEAYDAKLAELEEEQQEVKSLAEGMHIIIFHEAYAYVAKDYDMSVDYVMDLDEERQISAGEVADVVSAVEDNGISIILAEELYGKDMGDTVSKETDVNVVYIDPLNKGDYDKDSYISGMEANIEILKKAIEGKE